MSTLEILQNTVIGVDILNDTKDIATTKEYEEYLAKISGYGGNLNRFR